MITANLYVDGSCKGNPGPAGIGIVYFKNPNTVIQKDIPIEMATNNIAEIKATIEGLKLVDNPSQTDVTVYTDSALVEGLTMKGWKAKKNVELVWDLRVLIREFKSVIVKKVKGHAGDKWNEVADELASAAADRVIQIKE